MRPPPTAPDPSAQGSLPDDARLARFHPPLPAPAPPSPDPVTGQPSSQPSSQLPGPLPAPPPAPPAAPPPAPPATTWEDWSHLDRDRRERASLVVRIRGDRSVRGLAHAAAVVAHRSRVRTAAAVTVAATLPLVAGWFQVIGARNASLAQGLGDRSFAPFGFLLLLVTVLAAVMGLRWWRSIYRARPDPLTFTALPDSPDAPRHGAFDGSTTPPRRW